MEALRLKEESDKMASEINQIGKLISELKEESLHYDKQQTDLDALMRDLDATLARLEERMKKQ